MMAGSVELFHFFQKVQQAFGIRPPQLKQKQHSIELRNVLLPIFCAQLITGAGFLLFEAKSVFEYGFGFYVLITYIHVIAIYSIFIWENENIFEYFESCKKFIEKSK